MTDLSMEADRYGRSTTASGGARGHAPQMLWFALLSVAIGVLHMQGLYRPELSAGLLFG